MKLMTIAVIIAFFTLLPIAIVGSRYADGVLTDNTYNQSLDYDKARAVVQESSIVWSEPSCMDDICSIAVTIEPAPDANSLKLRVFRPADDKELLLSMNGTGPTWEGRFQYDNEGWYVHRVDYRADGVLVNVEKAYLLHE